MSADFDCWFLAVAYVAAAGLCIYTGQVALAVICVLCGALMAFLGATDL